MNRQIVVIEFYRQSDGCHVSLVVVMFNLIIKLKYSILKIKTKSLNLIMKIDNDKEIHQNNNYEGYF